MTNAEKAQASRAYGRNYLVFDENGNEYGTIRNRLLDHAMADAKVCKGEIWLSGKCVVPSWNVTEDKSHPNHHAKSTIY